MSRYIAEVSPGSVPASSPLRIMGSSLTRFLVKLMARQDVSQQRRRLMELDDRLLKDIGLSRADAEREFLLPLPKIKD
jgi:uncharacterized protein YjiS (DUF1127 family)